MEVEERYEVETPSLNGYAYIHDFKTDNILNTYDSCDLLNQQDKQIKELQKLIKENQKLKERIIELQEREESYINTMRYLNKTRTELLNTEKALELACEHIKEDLKCDDI